MAVQIDGSQGNVIATKGTYSGSVSIGGTLTYEDVTNIDSVGIITARTSIEVGARPGVGASISSDGNAIFSGITTITQLGGSPKLTSGQTITSTANDGNASIQGGLTYPGGHIRLGGGSGDDDIRFSVSGGSGTLSEKARIDSSGNIGAGTNSPSSFSASDFVISKSANAGITISVGNAGTTNTASIFFAEGTGGTGDKERGAIKYKHGDDYLAFHTNYDERVRIDSSGRLLVGATSSQSVGGGAALTQIQSVSSTGRLTVTQHRNEAGGSPYIVLGKSRGTSLGAVTVLQSGDEIGSLSWAGADGSDMESTAARIYSAVDATPGSNDMPGRLMFATTADGADSPTERLRITSAGDVKIIDGDLIMGTSGNGIDFSATSDGPNATTERFSDYESGTFTPTCANSVTLSTAQGFYVKVGEFVHIDMFIGVNSDNSNAAFSINNLPFAGGNGYDLSVPSCRIASWDLPTGTLWVSGNTDTNSCAFHCNKDNANYVNLPADSGGSLIISLDMEIA